MSTTLPGYRAHVPDYWLRVDPTLDTDNIPHCYNGNLPNNAASVNNGTVEAPDWAGVPIAPEGGAPLGGTATDAQEGTPGFFYPLGSKPADYDALVAAIPDGVGPSDAPWDVQGRYIVLGDGSEWHYRIDQWLPGRVP